MPQLTRQKWLSVYQCYQDGNPLRSIAEQFNIDVSAIYFAFKRMGLIYRRDPLPLSVEIQEEICNRYLSGERKNVLAKEFNICTRTVWKITNKRNLTSRRRRYIYDDHFFREIDTEEKAYWLGFIAADGSITRKDRLQICLAIVDFEHLEKFRNSLGSNLPIKKSTVKSVYSEECKTARISINSLSIVQGLKRFGIVPRKGLTVPWPNLPNEMLRHYLRGYFDGDGSYSILPRKDRINPQFTYDWGIIGHLAFLVDCQKFIIEECGLRETALIKHPSSGIGYLRYGGRLQVLHLSRLMYGGAKTYLKRKYDFIQSHFSDENLLLSDKWFLTREPLTIEQRIIRKCEKEPGISENKMAMNLCNGGKLYGKVKEVARVLVEQGVLRQEQKNIGGARYYFVK